ncbi:DUF2914 domain-containing protein [Candidatus Nomurabacteria bacterium]|nr:DUF2914 domain-containing protein [Candidatus Nomurabacteria bacterium]
MSTLTQTRDTIKDFIATHKHLTMPLILIGGFVADWFTLNRIDQVFDNLIFVIHLVLSGTAIAFLHATDFEYLQDHPKVETWRRWAQGIMLFSFGALYSGFFIFYLRSASFLTSWFLVLGLLAIMLATEWKQNYFLHRTVQIGVYYFALLCYSIFLIPILTNKISAGMFILSSLVSLAVAGCFVWVLWWLDRYGIRERSAGIVAGILGIVVIMNFFYFMNIIPPIPLSLQNKAPYLSITKEETSDGLIYHTAYEKTPWYNVIRTRSHRIAWQDGKGVYVFASVFAPNNIHAQIRHCWEWFDDAARAWKSATCIPITIVGGRDGGYRGFSTKSNVWPGRWRVRFLTKRDQELGQLRFRIVERQVDEKRLEIEAL